LKNGYKRLNRLGTYHYTRCPNKHDNSKKTWAWNLFVTFSRQPTLNCSPSISKMWSAFSSCQYCRNLNEILHISSNIKSTKRQTTFWKCLNYGCFEVTISMILLLKLSWQIIASNQKSKTTFKSSCYCHVSWDVYLMYFKYLNFMIYLRIFGHKP